MVAVDREQLTLPLGDLAVMAADPAYGAAFKDAALKNVVSNEANVRAVLTKIELGEADAGIVYKTDARVSKRVRVVYEVSGKPEIVYSLARVSDSRKKAAADFVRFLESREAAE